MNLSVFPDSFGFARLGGAVVRLNLGVTGALERRACLVEDMLRAEKKS